MKDNRVVLLLIKLRKQVFLCLNKGSITNSVRLVSAFSKPIAEDLASRKATCELWSPYSRKIAGTSLQLCHKEYLKGHIRITSIS